MTVTILTVLNKLPLQSKVNNEEHQEYRLIQSSLNLTEHVHPYCLLGLIKNEDRKSTGN